MNNFQRNIYRTQYGDLIPIITCNETASSGGVGVTEYTILLDKPSGGIVIMDFNANMAADKLEIIHNGVKKATSGMTAANSGPFDDLYGNPTIPTGDQASATDQFIGGSKGAIPTRDSIFLSETGITDIVRTKQQLIWWVYTQTDYELLNNVIVRVTGISGTAWDFQRLCTNQTPTQITPPTYLFGGGISQGEVSPVECNQIIEDVVYIKTTVNGTLSNGDILYNTNNETSPFIGEVGKYYSLITQDFNWSGVNRKWSVQVSPSGVIGISSVCPQVKEVFGHPLKLF